MADNVDVRLGGNSPEDIAYRLFTHIQAVERVSVLADPGNGYTKADRDWILKTYASCMMAVKQPNYHL